MSYYASSARDALPWRQPERDGSFDPYKIMVSELMLQQTQVARVIPKYEAFLVQFPTIAALAAAELGAVLTAWQGLGYNRRAKYLWQAANVVMEQGGALPDTIDELVKLPGIGKNTAGAIMAYAYNQPVVYVETNIRTVVIYHFFADQQTVSDGEIAARMQALLEMSSEDARTFYWALMDYGSHLKQTIGNLNKLSKTYVKQSKFHGSKRQVRGGVLRLLSEGDKTLNMLSDLLPDERLVAVLDELVDEEMIYRHAQLYSMYRERSS